MGRTLPINCNYNFIPKKLVLKFKSASAAVMALTVVNSSERNDCSFEN
jgi:hypothetical protein